MVLFKPEVSVDVLRCSSVFCIAFSCALFCGAVIHPERSRSSRLCSRDAVRVITCRECYTSKGGFLLDLLAFLRAFQ